MKKILRKIIIISSPILGWFLGVQSAFAQSIGSAAALTGASQAARLFGGNFVTSILEGAASIVSTVILSAAGWFVTLTGTLLNVGMYFTTHLDLFIKNSSSIFLVWETVRDLASLILIFFILWAAIQMILGLEDARFGTLIKNIVIMGILINFSFFFTRILIDASNIISLQFLNAIAPANIASVESLSIQNVLTTLANKGGGITDVFMGTFHITSWYTPHGVIQGDSGDPLKIILVGLTGAAVMVITSFSFIAIALATIVRIAILLFLLAFSPLWIASMVVPNLKEGANAWMKHFKSQLIFLPVYLGLLYVGLRIASESNLQGITRLTGSYTEGLPAFLNLFVAFVLIFFMVTIVPMLGAMKIAGLSGSWIDKTYKSMRGSFTGLIGRNTLGSAGSRYNKWASEVNGTSSKTSRILALGGNSQLGRAFRDATTNKLESNKFGSSQSYKDVKALNKEISKKDKEITRKSVISSQLNLISSKKAVNPADMKIALSKLNDKEKMGLGKDLKSLDVMRHLTKKDFDTIRKTEELSEETRNDILETRDKYLEDSVKKGDVADIKNLLKTYTGNELAEIFESKKNVLTDNNLISQLSISQIKNLGENSSDRTLKADIQKKVLDLGSTGSNVYGWINNNKDKW